MIISFYILIFYISYLSYILSLKNSIEIGPCFPNKVGGGLACKKNERYNSTVRDARFARSGRASLPRPRREIPRKRRRSLHSLVQLKSFEGPYRSVARRMRAEEPGGPYILRIEESAPLVTVAPARLVGAGAHGARARRARRGGGGGHDGSSLRKTPSISATRGAGALPTPYLFSRSD